MTAMTRRIGWRDLGVARFGVVAVLLATLGGCGGRLPDVRPFADATGNLATAVSAAEGPTERAIAGGFDPSMPQTRAEAAARAQRFAKVWRQRAAAVNAFSQYADGLAAVAQAGEGGEAAARAVTGEFMRLLEAIRPVAGVNAAVTAVGTAAEKIYGEYARHAAAATMAEAVNRNQRYVAQLAEALEKDWDELKKLVDSSFDEMMTVALAESEPERAALAEVAKHRAEARKAVIVGTVTPPARPDEQAKLAEARTKLEGLDRLYNQITGDPKYQQGQKALADLTTRKAELLELIDWAKAVTAQWAVSHGELAVALRERRPVSFRRLVQLSQELLEVYEKARRK